MLPPESSLLKLNSAANFTLIYADWHLIFRYVTISHLWSMTDTTILALDDDDMNLDITNYEMKAD